MHHHTSVRFVLFLLLIAVFAPFQAIAGQQGNYAYGPLPVFELHSGFWINLHHSLYQEARERKERTQKEKDARDSQKSSKTTVETKPVLTAAEQKIWNEAVSFYATTYSDKDLQFSTELIQLKDQLGDFEDCNELSGRVRKFCDAGLPSRLTQVLESVAPVYRARIWPEHDRANRGWIARVSPLVISQGVVISERLAEIYQARWPRQRIRVDVTSYASWAGAYATTDPLRVTISSLDTRNQGTSALEVLFHEASHGIAEPVQAAIIRECRQRDKAIPRDLWHALVFYTTGEVIRPILAASEPSDGSIKGSVQGYTPYAMREGIYQRGWNEYLQLLQRFWLPYLNGSVSFEDAVAHMVSAL
jgi:hypothetical protein